MFSEERDPIRLGNNFKTLFMKTVSVVVSRQKQVRECIIFKKVILYRVE